jgi:hypothetical protein
VYVYASTSVHSLLLKEGELQGTTTKSSVSCEARFANKPNSTTTRVQHFNTRTIPLPLQYTDMYLLVASKSACNSNSISFTSYSRLISFMTGSGTETLVLLLTPDWTSCSEANIDSFRRDDFQSRNAESLFLFSFLYPTDQV